MAGLVVHCHHARFLFNLGLEQRSMWRRDRHVRGPLSASRIDYSSQAAELAELRAELDWMRAGSSSVQQQALRDLDRAFQNFFAGRAGYPEFKKRDDRDGGFYIRDLKVTRLNRRWGVVAVPKVGRVRFKITRRWADIAAASSARVTIQNGRWHVAFTTPPAEKIIAGTGAMVGIDRGVANTIATSDGGFDHAPEWTRGEQHRFLAFEQRLSRQTRAAKKSGRQLWECRNRARTLDRLAVLRRRLDQRRTDWVEQTTTRIAHTYDVVVVEDLAVRNMVRGPAPQPDPDQVGRWLPNRARAKAKLNKAILASRWGQFATRLDDKTTVVRVNAAYSSQECRQCGHIEAGNRESQAVFTCQRCGHTAHADINAARNILFRGEHQLAHAAASNPRTSGARLHKPSRQAGRRNPTGGRAAA